MLGVTFTTRAELDDGDARRKKEKKGKKKKKEKRNKREKREKRTANDSSDKSGSDNDDGRNPAKLSGGIQDTEAAVKEHGESKQMAEAELALQREDWMTKPMKREPTKSQQEDERREEERQKQVAEPEIVAGLRIMKKPDPAASLRDASRQGAAAAPGGRGLSSGLVGDGGASWRLKALRRAQEQARAEGRSLQEVVGERWGSLAQLTEELTSTVAADGKAHLRAAAERRRAAAEGAPPVVPHYLQDVRTDRAKMLRPAEDASLSWRRDRDCNRGERNRRGDVSAGRSHDREGGEEPAARPNGPDREDHARDRNACDDDRVPERERVRRPAYHAREEDNLERDDRKRRDGEGWDSQPSDRGLDGRAAERRDDGGSRGREHDQGQEWGRERGRDGGRDRERERYDCGGGRDSGTGGSRVSSLPSKEQMVALRQLAGSLNTFDDDGSFMERFTASQGGRQQQREGEQAPTGYESYTDQKTRGLDEAPGGTDVDDPGVGKGSPADLDPSCSGDAGACPGPGHQNPNDSRRAPLFVRGGEDDDGQGRAGGGGGSGGGGIANKSVAEFLRARLKGLPLPSSAATTAVKPEPVGDDGKLGPSDSRRAEGRGGGSGGGSGRGHVDASDWAVAMDDKPHREVVMLPLVDAQGRAVRGAFGREAAGAGAAPNAGRRAGSKPPERYNRQTGEKERYFADDDKVDLQAMIRRAKYGDDDMDMDEHLAANIAKKRKFRGTDLDVDAEYDYDGGLEMYESRAKRGNAEAQRNRDRNRQVAEQRRQEAAEAGCMLCLNNPKCPKHLTIALGTCAYLSLPYRGRLVRGHCCVAPSEHCPSIRGLDEATWTEVKNFIKCLIRMHGAQGQSVIFMETYMKRSGSRHHAVLDVVPVTEQQLEKARGYFKKAILEAESEWSTHHAKACIGTTAQKGLRESIPPNFPYFYVQFGYSSGYVHVIDDESKFDPNFGRQVIIGLLDLPPEMAHQRQKVESQATQQQWVREFEAQWDLYDWTRQLDAA
ncbi:hypothetical protein VaNZ11_010972 [Volvox africanus]|uniref:CWF19-like protein 2 n=1 Tax=Volvox africanus TaxID=51714 RepID=A0ABQ5SAG7_9CHLO|nr:hypothetical protein VaNZ11_010972 [Volvox africanus]